MTAQVDSSGSSAATRAEVAIPPRRVPADTLYLLLLGAMLFCVAAGVNAVAPRDGADVARSSERMGSERVEPPVVIHAASATGTSR